MSFAIQEIPKLATAQIRKKCEDPTTAMKVDMNGLQIPVNVTDPNLVKISKTTFMQLPVPIRNLVLALGECETEMFKSKEKHMSECTRRVISGLEVLSQTIQTSSEIFQDEIAEVSAKSAQLWKDDMESYTIEINQLRDLVNSLTGTSCDCTDLYKCIIDQGIRLGAYTSHTIKHKHTVEEFDTTNIKRRLDVSKAYREHAKQLQGSFKVSDLYNLPSCDTESKETEEEIAEVLVEKDIRESDLRELVLEQRRLKGILAQLWIPHRKASMNAISNASKAFAYSIRNACKQYDSLEWPNEPSLDSIRANKALVQKEFDLMIPAFPCDNSALKTCITVLQEGAAVAYARKLQELRSEVVRAISVYFTQVNTALTKYHECSNPESIL